MKTIIIVLLKLLMGNHICAMPTDGLTVTLDHGGSLTGKYLESFKGRKIRSFQGIPYAKPPVGALRFEPPIPFPPWTGTREATKEGNVCPQIDHMANGAEIGNEDCLFLNVYTPHLEVINKTGNLPVMVYFHGGGWLMGSGNRDNYGPEFFLDHNVVLVTGNYRLGALGFLSTETLDYPGNNALKDQLEILKWVQQHIKSFGGNPESVTIFGESSGSHSVSNHLQSPLSKGFFHRAIQQSGFIFNAAAYPARKCKVVNNTQKLVKSLNCEVEGESLKESIDRLKKVDVFEIVKKELTFYEWMYYPTCPFQPVLEPEHSNAFMKEYPRNSGLNSLEIPVMVGAVSDEGLLGSAPILANSEFAESFKKEVKSKYPIMFNFEHLDLDLQEKIKNEIDEFYFKDGHNYDIENHQNLTNLFSDAFFLSGLDEYLEKRLSQNSANTFVYIFDHKSSMSLANMISGGNDSFGVCHGDELPMLFPVNKALHPSSNYTEKDLLMKEELVKMWVNFATYGNPTPTGSFSKWKPTTNYPWNYVKLGSQDVDDWYIIENKEGFARERMEFWKKISSMIEGNSMIV